MIDTRTALRNLLAAHDKLSKASGDARNQAIAAVEVAEDAAREALEADDGLALRMETDRADGNARSCHGFMAALKTIRDAAEEAIGMPWDIGGMPQPTTPQPAAGWTCLARKQSLPEPAECNWPDCGCDPHAMKVIESLVEQGWTAPREAPAPAEGVSETNAAIKEAIDCITDLGSGKGGWAWEEVIQRLSAITEHAAETQREGQARKGPGGAPMCDYTKFGNCYDVHLRCKWCPMRGKPGPSEPSPPADRREIVAQALSFLRDVAQNKETWTPEAERVYQHAQKTVAALDGGRDA